MQNSYIIEKLAIIIHEHLFRYRSCVTNLTIYYYLCAICKNFYACKASCMCVSAAGSTALTTRAVYRVACQRTSELH